MTEKKIYKSFEEFVHARYQAGLFITSVDAWHARDAEIAAKDAEIEELTKTIGYQHVLLKGFEKLNQGEKK